MTPEIAKHALTYFEKNHQPATEESSSLLENEQIVLAHLANGFSQKQIALDFLTSEAVVQDTIKNIYRKLHSINKIAHKQT